MAELDPEKVANMGVDPGTGSPLSQEVRNALLKKSAIDSSVFKKQIADIENRKNIIDAQTVNVIKNQEQALFGFNSNIQTLRTDIGKLGTGLASIALLMQQDNANEQARARTEQENQRRLTERQIRIGKESEIEQKIQNALTEPVSKLAPKVENVFGKIGAALGFLFGGWLTKQTVDAIKASEEGNTKLFNDIKYNILKTIGIAVGGVFAISKGFSLIKNTIGRIASGITRLLIVKPLVAASALLAGRGIKPKTPKPGPSGNRGGKGPGIFGAAWAIVESFMNFKNKEYIDAIIPIVATFGPGKFIRGLFAAGYVADQIAEIFGKNIFGKDPNKEKEAKAIFEEEKNKKKDDKPAASPKPAPSAAPPAAQPQTPMMGEQKPSTPPPSPEMVSKFEQAWKLRNAGWARGSIEDTWNQMTPEQKQQAKDWASSKGYNWSEMKLSDPSSTSAMPSASPAPSSSPNISPAQMSTPPKEPSQVGQLPEPQPSITMIKSSNNQSQQSTPPITNGSLTDVPLINSANPDNFYVLYSQLNYNVVM